MYKTFSGVFSIVKCLIKANNKLVSVHCLSTLSFLHHFTHSFKLNYTSSILRNNYQQIFQYSTDLADLKTPEEIVSISNSLLEGNNASSLPDTDVLNLGKTLTELMYQLYLQKEREKLINLFLHMKTKNVQLDSSYTIMFRYFADTCDYYNVNKYFQMLNDDPNVLNTARCYVPLINVCLKTSRYQLAEEHLNNLNELMKLRFQDHLYCSIIATCTQVLTKDNENHVRKIVENILTELQYFGPTGLKKNTAESLNDWFQKDTLMKWKITKTVIGENNGVCQFCKRKISSNSIPSDRIIKLKRNLMTLVKAAIAQKKTSKLNDIKVERINTDIKDKVKSNARYFDLYDAFAMTPVGKSNKNSATSGCNELGTNNVVSGEIFDTLKGLKMLLDDSEPFDVVIDALNIGYFSQGFNPSLVHDVVKMFVQQNKRILILCAGIMKEDLLSADVLVPPARRRIQYLMQYLKKHCQLFFVESSMVDDYYILYTLIHHDFKINLVSRDLFRDHLLHLNAENSSDFKKWQQTNQYIFKAFQKDGSPIFKSRTMYHSGVKAHSTGWHIPINNSDWLCVLKEKRLNKFV